MTPDDVRTVTHSAEGLATMVAFVNAWRRTGEPTAVDAADFGKMIARTVADIEAKPDAHSRLCWLVYQLAAGAGDLCEQWNNVADGAPADAWLAECAESAALDLVDVSGV